MENKQTIIVDEELLNKLLEVKLDQYFESKKSDIETFIARLVRVKIEETLKENNAFLIPPHFFLNNLLLVHNLTFQY